MTLHRGVRLVGITVPRRFKHIHAAEDMMLFRSKVVPNVNVGFLKYVCI